MEVQEAMKRSGHTLVELVAVMTATSAVVAAVVVLVAFVLRMSGEVRQQTHTVATINRLAEQFRRDAHQAQGEPAVAADHLSAEFHLPGGRTVAWRTESHRGLVRTEHAAKTADRENSYTLPQGSTAAFELQPQGEGRIVALHIESPGTGGPCLSIEALAARDERPATRKRVPRYPGVEEEK
jgi:type II secretory pathway pseudopilin PulG